MIEVGFGRAARDLLEPAGLAVDYLETDAGHWLPPEIVPRARAFVADILAPLRPCDEGGSGWSPAKTAPETRP